MAKKALTWIVIAFVVLFVAFNPGTAAKVTESLGALVVNIGKGFGDFFTRLAT
ncbi:hypothetical protein ACNTMW_00150 [Planosporangium sp. 12N6]|uniref:hypothetical protein n=1 Tax=Planosporangium spinosum TaxID=3402278 RepID=UPI003CF1D67C